MAQSQDSSHHASPDLPGSGGHVLPELLSAWIEGDVPAHELTAIASHLATCELCRAEKDALQSILTDVRQLPELSAPPAFVARVLDRVENEAPVGVLDKLIAFLGLKAPFRLGRLVPIAAPLAVAVLAVVMVRRPESDDVSMPALKEPPSGGLELPPGAESEAAPATQAFSQPQQRVDSPPMVIYGARKPIADDQPPEAEALKATSAMDRLQPPSDGFNGGRVGVEKKSAELSTGSSGDLSKDSGLDQDRKRAKAAAVELEGMTTASRDFSGGLGSLGTGGGGTLGYGSGGGVGGGGGLGSSNRPLGVIGADREALPPAGGSAVIGERAPVRREVSGVAGPAPSAPSAPSVAAGDDSGSAAPAKETVLAGRRDHSVTAALPAPPSRGLADAVFADAPAQATAGRKDKQQVASPGQGATAATPAKMPPAPKTAPAPASAPAASGKSKADQQASVASMLEQAAEEQDEARKNAVSEERAAPPPAPDERFRFARPDAIIVLELRNGVLAGLRASVAEVGGQLGPQLSRENGRGRLPLLLPPGSYPRLIEKLRARGALGATPPPERPGAERIWIELEPAL